MKKIFLTAALINKDGFFLLAKRNEKRHLQSMWEFPQAKPSFLGLKVGKGQTLPMVRHAIMNQSILLTPRLWQFVAGRPKTNQRYVAYRWIALKDLQNFPTSSINHKICSILS